MRAQTLSSRGKVDDSAHLYLIVSICSSPLWLVQPIAGIVIVWRLRVSLSCLYGVNGANGANGANEMARLRRTQFGT